MLFYVLENQASSEVTAQETAATATEALEDAHAAQASAATNTQNVESLIAAAEPLTQIAQMQAAMVGVVMMALDSLSTNVTAASLNAAATGSFVRTFEVALRMSATGSIYTWAHFTPDAVTPAEDCVDVDIGAPTVSGSPYFNSGRMVVRIVFDTDAGVTKVYQAGDEVTVTVDINSIPLFVNVANVVKTYAVT